ncbi:DNA topoisomerase IB [Sinosporangium siamense]|uniref:DNA topoisomerase n=1 Tax=Sinosporangium siamense TaxID=1367973 RepID=A0A919VDV3_9ACTN|nr:DNA topoisomerase IB [Sinosporangium siamense]GII94504.1 DNA topoisomerase [Sinosporangium siamense]
MRLTRSDRSAPGITRHRRGHGFSYTTPSGQTLTDPEDLQRVKDLVIPPAWTSVWICPSPRGHIQAVGYDQAGRLQYRYHDEWRRKRDLAKYEHVRDMATRLPRIRRVLAERMRGRGLSRDRVLSTAVRLLDLGSFRIGGERYADDNDTYGLATLRCEHARCSQGEVVFTYPAKGGRKRVQVISDPVVCQIIRSLRRRGPARAGLLRYWSHRKWHDVRSDDINAYLQDLFGEEVTAKDFRTWHATVLAAVGLAVSSPADSPRTRKRAVARVMAEVADYLGNTPALARASYVDPRLIDLYEEGRTIAAILPKLGKDVPGGVMATHGEAERAVIRLLGRT